MTKTERVVWDDMLEALKFVEAFHEALKNPSFGLPVTDCFYGRSETRSRVKLAIEAADKENENDYLRGGRHDD